MNKTFKIGEKAIVISSNPEFKDREVTVIERLQLCHNHISGKSWFGYPTDYICSDGLQLAPQPHMLRKKSNDGDGLRVSESTKIDSSNKVGQPPIKQPERATA